MAATTEAPFVAQSIQENAALIENLKTHARGNKGTKKSFSCKGTTYAVPDSKDKIKVESWRFQDWDYKRRDLPTYARGLFTSSNEDGHPEIVTRGYDKFFNIDEVPETRWKHIEDYTTGPYEISTKENGCIIFISGLYDGTLLVCSKHSTGPREGSLSHSEAGSQWIDRQLEGIGKTRKDLAKELRRRNATAVAELCDDEFEEHILAYNKDMAGLYLHGINLNVPQFTTYPGAAVHEFADAWGFKRTDFLVCETLESTRGFLEGVAETGHYNGRDVEGFVIRCKAKDGARLPYHDWFFKYKFEEPYLMYRQWRECTKALISGKRPMFKKHIRITEEYLLYAKDRLIKDRQLSSQYNHNHGIIALRDDFLKEKNMKGSDIIREEYAAPISTSPDVEKDVILVPIATIGCGKTTLALALQHLFGWGHIQNDNITGKARPPRFTKAVLTQLETHNVVIADRNNTQRRERKQILEDVKIQHETAKLVALHFVHTPERIARIRETTRHRVLSRGDNHQTLQAHTDPNKVIGIMEGFISRFEPFNTFVKPDDGFDGVIDLDPTASSRDNLETLISKLHELYPRLIKELPSADELDAAIEFALGDYKPDLRHELSVQERIEKQQLVTKAQQSATSKKAPKPKPLEYVGVTLPRPELHKLVEDTFASQPAEVARFFKILQQTRRIQTEFHVTLIHRASSKTYPDLWNQYSQIHGEAGGGDKMMGKCKVLLERIVWDNRLMAIAVRLVNEEEAPVTWQTINRVAHITIGTASQEIKPKESNDLLERWMQIGSGEDTGIQELVVDGRIMLDGIVKGVLSR